MVSLHPDPLLLLHHFLGLYLEKTGVVGHECSRGVELVVGVDTHQEQHVAVAIDRQGVR